MAVDPDPVSGERRRLSRTVHGTRSEAKDALQRMVVDAGGGLYGGGRVTLGDLLDQFLASATLGPTTRADWLSVTERHLKPALGEMPLWKLTSRDCDQLYARMKAAGLGQSGSGVPTWSCTVLWPKRCAGDGSSATRSPTPRGPGRQGHDHPARGRRRPHRARSSRKADVELWCWSPVAIASGARRGEVCALRWCDVDLDKRFVRIERSVSATASAGVVIKSTKTGKPGSCRSRHRLSMRYWSDEHERHEPPLLPVGISMSRSCLRGSTIGSSDLGDPTWSPGAGPGSAGRSASATSDSTTCATSSLSTVGLSASGT